MQNFKNIIEAINDFSIELESSGKSDTSIFFKNTSDKIKNVTDEKEARKILEHLMSSGSLSQYADFTYKEDQLFDAIIDEAEKLVHKMEC